MDLRIHGFKARVCSILPWCISHGVFRLMAGVKGCADQLPLHLSSLSCRLDPPECNRYTVGFINALVINVKHNDLCQQFNNNCIGKFRMNEAARFMHIYCDYSQAIKTTICFDLILAQQ